MVLKLQLLEVEQIFLYSRFQAGVGKARLNYTCSSVLILELLTMKFYKPSSFIDSFFMSYMVFFSVSEGHQKLICISCY